jgi:hypothetical protein
MIQYFFSATRLPKIARVISVRAIILMKSNVYTIAFGKQNTTWPISLREIIKWVSKKSQINWSDTHSFIIKAFIVIWRVIFRAYVNKLYCPIGFVSFPQHVYLHRHEITWKFSCNGISMMVTFCFSHKQHKLRKSIQAWISKNKSNCMCLSWDSDAH